MNRVLYYSFLLALVSACNNFTTEKPVCRGEAVISLAGVTGDYDLVKVDGTAEKEAVRYTVTEPTPAKYRIRVDNEEVGAVVCMFAEKTFVEFEHEDSSRQIAELVRTTKGIDLFFQVVDKATLAAKEIPFTDGRTFGIDNTASEVNDKLVSALGRAAQMTGTFNEMTLEKVRR